MLGVNIMKKWLSLKEASELTGKNIPALRQAIKRGKLKGEKISGLTGDKWIIDPESIPQSIDSPQEVLIDTSSDYPFAMDETTGAVNRQNVLTHKDELVFDKTANLYERLLEEKDRLNGEKGKHIDTLNILLGNFQGRIQVLESDRDHLEKQLKLLPAPPQEVGKLLLSAEEALQSTESSLEALRTDHEKAVLEVSRLSSALEETTTREKAMRREKDAVQSALSLVNKEIDELRSLLTARDAEILILNQEKAGYQEDCARKDERIHEMEGLLSSLGEEMAKLKETLERETIKIRSSLEEEITTLKAAMDQMAQEKELVQKALSTLWDEKATLQKRLEEEQNRPWWKKSLKWV